MVLRILLLPSLMDIRLLSRSIFISTVRTLFSDRPAPGVRSFSTKMGIHEWSYDSAVSNDQRFSVPHNDNFSALADRKVEVELGFDEEIGFAEAQRCLNCDIQTVFEEAKCIECDSCVDICPTYCITFTRNAEEDDLRKQLSVPATEMSQDLYVSDVLPTQRVMVKE